MEPSLIISACVFLALTGGAWAAINMLSPKTSRASERLEELRDPGRRNRDKSDGKGGVGGLFERAAPQMSKALKPKTELEQNNLKVRLANAGFNSPAAPQIYLALKLASLLCGLFLGGGFAAFKYGVTMNGLTSIVVGCAAGLFIPSFALSWKIKGRMERIFLGLPDTLDLLVVCVEAGLGLDAGMRRVAEELEDTHPDVCAEFNLANMQLQMGRKRREVLHDLGVRTGVDDMRALVAILIQADKFGSSIAQALRVQSDSMRIKRSQMAEERAQQTAVKLIFPLVLFIFPGIFVVLVGPAALMMINGLFAQ
ncbi:type II secretion system F family protein [Thalassoroseus pseudoceratinae]|uniref:type II secretion system F family protein n=1 Tax=Thalassoroseus pseudoceratinae TaxID=2713176 RepID=UPI0014234FCC|nr:type II secretion system F family protein [Thalassoroseus pseudoceratinae]